jgi:hypothetical protein
LADFISGPEPRLEFNVEGNEYKFVLRKNKLKGAFKGMFQGFYLENATEMEKYPKK